MKQRGISDEPDWRELGRLSDAWEDRARAFGRETIGAGTVDNMKVARLAHAAGASVSEVDSEWAKAYRAAVEANAAIVKAARLLYAAAYPEDKAPFSAPTTA